MAALFGAYITNLGKYNEGELVGETLKFPTTTEAVSYTHLDVYKRQTCGKGYSRKLRIAVQGDASLFLCDNRALHW